MDRYANAHEPLNAHTNAVPDLRHAINSERLEVWVRPHN